MIAPWQTLQMTLMFPRQHPKLYSRIGTLWILFGAMITSLGNDDPNLTDRMLTVLEQTKPIGMLFGAYVLTGTYEAGCAEQPRHIPPQAGQEPRTHNLLFILHLQQTRQLPRRIRCS